MARTRNGSSITAATARPRPAALIVGATRIPVVPCTTRSRWASRATAMLGTPCAAASSTCPPCREPSTPQTTTAAWAHIAARWRPRSPGR